MLLLFQKQHHQLSINFCSYLNCFRYKKRKTKNPIHLRSEFVLLFHHNYHFIMIAHSVLYEATFSWKEPPAVCCGDRELF